MSVITSICKAGIIFYLLTSLLPLSRSDHWLIRAWDFPRLQLLFFALIFGIIVILTVDWKEHKNWFFVACLLIGSGFDLYRILPYTILWPKESVNVDPGNYKQTLSLVTVNVLQKNENPEPLLKMIKNISPDIIFLLEVNERWIRDLDSLNEIYPHTMIRPLDNTYGLALYSKLKLHDAEIRELIEKDVPSIQAKVELRSGQKIELFGLHPRPPHYETVYSTERDAELIQIAKEASKSKLPVIVMGDLNDVAWSHTTRLFRRLSNLLDPRVGRGTFPTFPATVPFFRFPLDYVFYSDDMSLASIKRLDNIESDHYPMFIELNYSPSKEAQQEAPSKNEGDEKEARQTLQKVQ